MRARVVSTIFLALLVGVGALPAAACECIWLSSPRGNQLYGILAARGLQAEWCDLHG
jgi:hypothetical protein